MTRSRLIPVLLAAVLLIGAANLGAYAANGDPLLLGKGSKATKTTKLKTTGNGAALSLKSKAGAAPLAVSNSTKVTKLNADLVDGLEGDALRTKSFVYSLTSPATTLDYISFQLPGLPPGRYHASFSVPALITGDPVTFFGCFLATGSGTTISAPVVGLGIASSAGGYFASGSGYVDTAAAPYRLLCQVNGGTEMTIPSAPNFPASIVFTRVDDVTSAASTGAPTTLPRGLTP